MCTVNGRFSRLPIHLREPHHNVMRVLLWWLSCICLCHFQLSAECCLNVTWRQCVSCEGSAPAFFDPWRLIWFWKCQVFTEFPCKCGKVYIGQTGCLIETRIKECNGHSSVPTREVCSGWIQHPARPSDMAKKPLFWQKRWDMLTGS
jgi:hypothetical protein